MVDNLRLGTNWGNLGYALGYTSYDYGAAIAEDRTLMRQKYGELKLEANFLASSPAYLTAIPGNASNGSFADTNQVAVTLLKSNDTSFYVTRHAAYNSNISTQYRLTIATSLGTISIPQLSPGLSLNGRDSKIHVAEYEMANLALLYSSAEIFTWKNYGGRKILLVYGGPEETHEMGFATSQSITVVDDREESAQQKRAESHSVLQIKTKGGVQVVNWTVSSSRTILEIGRGFFVYLLDRQEAFKYWVLDVQGNAPNKSTKVAQTSVVIKAGYLLRTAHVANNTLLLTGDINSTTAFEVIGAPPQISGLSFNGKSIAAAKNAHEVLSAQVNFEAQNFSIPELSSLNWKFINSLPEIKSSYDDTRWIEANRNYTLNPRKLMTPTSLYGSDYGFNAGTLLLRGSYTATGDESTLFLETQGGTAFGHSIWLNETFIGSYRGISIYDNQNQTVQLPECIAGSNYVLTIVIDTTGFEEENAVGNGTMKHPRGILRYNLAAHVPTDVKWKITGNLGGEDYRDRTRGPLNEGGTFAERMGYHLPAPPSGKWQLRNPVKDGLQEAGIGFFSAKLDLDLPRGYDIPLSFVFGNSTSTTEQIVPAYRVQLFVNGYQFGKYGQSSD